MTARSRRRGLQSADPRHGRHVVRLGPGDHAVTTDPETLLLTVLGSCVAACMRDPVAGVGGMNHFMLPESPDGNWGTARFSLRYGNFAMEQLINDILHHGGQRARLEVKVFGGARIGPDTSTIGERNARYIEDYLRAEGLAPLASHLRGVLPRRIAYLPVSGRAYMVEISGAETPVRAAELGFSHELEHAPHSGSVELFQ